ncbi:DUF3833 domain-containing protein [Pseudoalteromonas sp. JC28]|uniref:DUF3833 domain-containing protein n=1 Tax=Pseudoalteromonas sp. JC28 TaxID=2267617 RepID=UPI001574A6B3|nr:DUF3833 domain-containing protein [Pseudoalteromonas sp. JC28]NSY33909.1 DUF3833 domain-containing protein [Pseudoalteromonas sp. JC28]
MRITLAILTLFLLSACSSGIDGKKYSTLKPQFNPYEFFVGDIKAWGIVQDRDGNLVQQFTVDIKGSINNKSELVLDESFNYLLGDGVKTRVWTITKASRNQYSGRADDILNSASGETYGNAMNWQYRMDLPVDDTSYEVHFDDWMWSFDQTTLMNRSYIEKFGIVMAEVTIFMQRQ